MFSKLNQFSKMFKQLDKECLKHSDEDLTLLEATMGELVDAWTDYLMSGLEKPTRKQIREHLNAVSMVISWDKENYKFRALKS